MVLTMMLIVLGLLLSISTCCYCSHLTHGAVAALPVAALLVLPSVRPLFVPPMIAGAVVTCMWTV